MLGDTVIITTTVKPKIVAWVLNIRFMFETLCYFQVEEWFYFIQVRVHYGDICG
jgi:hypothetical protein